MEAAAILESFAVNGQWYEFTAVGGKKVSTKRPEVAEIAKAFIGQPVVIDFTEKVSSNINPYKNEPYVDRYLNSIRPASGVNTTPVPTSTLPATTFATTPAPMSVTTSTTAGNATPDRGVVAGRNNIIGHALPYLLSETGGDKEAITALLNRAVAWTEHGGDFFPPAMQPVTQPSPYPPQLQTAPQPHPGDQLASEIQQQFPGTTTVGAPPYDDGIPF